MSGFRWDTDRSLRTLVEPASIFARRTMKDGVSLGQVRAEMNSIASQLAHDSRRIIHRNAAVLVLPLRESWYGNITTALWLLFGATALVLFDCLRQCREPASDASDQEAP